MPNTIVLNRSNLVGTDNNTFEYKFPSPASFKNHAVAVNSISVNYSWVNISTALDNNKFQYQWYGHASGLETHTITIPDGLYELNTINSYLQFEMVKNGNYLINAQGNYVYYIEFIVNPSQYKYQLNTFSVPTATQFNSSGGSQPTTGSGDFDGWTTPTANLQSGTGAWTGFHTQNFNPKITLLPNNFYKILGFPNLYESNMNLGTNTNLSDLSTTAPEIQPNANVYISMSNIQNEYANPSTIIHSLVVSGSFGSTILDRPNELAYNKLIPGQYSQIRIQFLGSDLSPLKILDPDTVIVLLIKEI